MEYSRCIVYRFVTISAKGSPHPLDTERFSTKEADINGGSSLGRMLLLGAVTALAFVAGIVVFPTLAAQLRGETDTTPRVDQSSAAPVATPQVVEQATQKPNIPELTEDERSEAVSLATNNPFVAQILADREYSVSSVGVWHTSRELQKIGAGVIISLAQPATLELDWPTIDFDRTELTTPPYQQRTEHYLATGVQRLVVMVDLRRGEVVSVGPGPEAGTPPRSFTDPIDFGTLGR